MVLKTGPRTKSDLPTILSFDWFLVFFSDQTSDQFPIQPVRQAGTVFKTLYALVNHFRNLFQKNKKIINYFNNFFKNSFIKFFLKQMFLSRNLGRRSDQGYVNSIRTCVKASFVRPSHHSRITFSNMCFSNRRDGNIVHVRPSKKKQYTFFFFLAE